MWHPPAARQWHRPATVSRWNDVWVAGVGVVAALHLPTTALVERADLPSSNMHQSSTTLPSNQDLSSDCRSQGLKHAFHPRDLDSRLMYVRSPYTLS
mmetsp:Transcript_15186/g.35581  ORF Transcript_15186/g.35581 Transcript_15186/m.35581 type:complete len:97 (+) Transcript_15186:513-803(+)